MGHLEARAVSLTAATEEFDGSDSGARPDEAVSWGKIRMDARPVKVGPKRSETSKCLLLFGLR